MKVLKSGVEMTPEELIASKAGKACACACPGGGNTIDMWNIGAEQTTCFCNCWGPIKEVMEGHDQYPRDYPY